MIIHHWISLPGSAGDVAVSRTNRTGQASQQALQALLLVLAQPERAELRCEVLLVLPRLVGPPRCKMFCRFLSEKHQFDSHFRSDSLWGKLCSSVECRILVTEFWCPVDVSWSCDYVKARHLRSGCCGWSGFGRQWCLCVQCGCAGQQFGRLIEYRACSWSWHVMTVDVCSDTQHISTCCSTAKLSSQTVSNQLLFSWVKLSEREHLLESRFFGPAKMVPYSTLWQFNIAMQHHHFERDFIHFYRLWLPCQTVLSDVAVPGTTKNVPPWRPRAARHPVPELQGKPLSQ